jgi:hypothetical protein
MRLLQSHYWLQHLLHRIPKEEEEQQQQEQLQQHQQLLLQPASETQDAGWMRLLPFHHHSFQLF